VPLSSAKRASIAAVALALLVGAAAAYLRFENRNGTRTAVEPGTLSYPSSPQQVERTLGILNELPGDAPAVAYIDVDSLRKLQASPLAVLLGLTGSDVQDHEYQLFVRETGFDYTRDLDQAAIAFWPGRPEEKNSRAPEDNLAFVIADGHFDEERIRAYARKAGGARIAGKQEIYGIPGKPPVALEFLSPTRMVICSGAKAKDLLASFHSAAIDSYFQARINRVGGAPFFAVVRTDKLSKSFYANFRSSPQIEKLARSIVGLTLAAQPQGNGLGVVLEGESTSAKNALAIASLLEISRMGASIVLSDPKAPAQLTNQQATLLDSLVRKSTIKQEDRWVRLGFDITPEMVGSGKPASPASTESKGNSLHK
jgi:hypothetical protein